MLSGANLAGPLIAGAPIAGMGVSQVLWINAVTFVVSAAVVRVAVPRSMSLTTKPGMLRGMLRGSYVGEVREGFRFIRRDPLIFSMVIMSALTGVVAGGMTGVTLLVYANEVCGSATHLGVMYAGAGAGFLLGGVIYGIIVLRAAALALLRTARVSSRARLWPSPYREVYRMARHVHDDPVTAGPRVVVIGSVRA